jgi:hypothetical protein
MGEKSSHTWSLEGVCACASGFSTYGKYVGEQEVLFKALASVKGRRDSFGFSY